MSYHPDPQIDAEEAQMNAMSNWEKSLQAALVAARDRAYPSHVGHDCEEKDVKYFDALMLYVDAACGCGETLRIDRDHF